MRFPPVEFIAAPFALFMGMLVYHFDGKEPWGTHLTVYLLTVLGMGCIAIYHTYVYKS